MEGKKIESPAAVAAPPDRLPVGRWARGLLFLVLWAAFALGAVALQSARLSQVALNAPYVDKMFMPETQYAKVLSFGYGMAVADFLYVRAIQAFGAKSTLAKENPATAFHFFDTMIALDPRFSEACEFGALVMVEGGHPDLAIELDGKGWANNPGAYRLPYLNAYTANFTMHDPLEGKKWAMKAIRAHDSPDWLVRWLAYLDRESGRYEAALEFHLRNILTDFAEPGRDVERLISVGQIGKIAEEWHLAVLNEAVKRYLKEHDNALPADLAALGAAGYLKNLRTVDYPATDRLLSDDRLDNMLEEKRKAQLSAKYTDLLDDAMRICVHEQSGIPAAVTPEDKRPNSYLLRHDLDLANATSETLKSMSFVTTSVEARNATMRALSAFLRPGIQAFLEKHGAYPRTLDEAFAGQSIPQEEIANRWDYDSETGTVRSPTFPDV